MDEDDLTPEGPKTLGELIAEMGSKEEFNRRILDEALQDSSWEYDPEGLVLRPTDPEWNWYDIDLGRMVTAVAVLGTIAHINEKRWATPKVMGDLVRILDALFSLHCFQAGVSIDVQEVISSRGLCPPPGEYRREG